MKKTVGLALSVAIAFPGLAVAMPAHAGTPSSLHTVAAADGDVAQAEESLAELDQALENLETATATDPDIRWSTEFRTLTRTLAELRQTAGVIATGGISLIDPQLAFTRVDLLVQIAATIADSSNNLSNKIQAAHVELGFAVTRAIVRLVNPGATVAQLQAAVDDLAATYERVSTYRDLEPGDTATIYVKSALRKAVWETRFARDKNILGKKEFAVYHELNRAITSAVGVQLNPQTTVADVQSAIDSLGTAYAKALAAPDKK